VDVRVRACAAVGRQPSPGGGTLPGFDTIHTLFACLMGSIVLVRLGRYDGVARFLFSAWMAWALAVSGTPLLWLFLIPGFCRDGAQWLPVDVQGSGSRTERAPLTSAAPMRSSRGG
jgi:hypothetical protein